MKKRDPRKPASAARPIDPATLADVSGGATASPSGSWKLGNKVWDDDWLAPT